MVINIVKQCISDNLAWRSLCCNTDFQKYPLFFEKKKFKYNRNSEGSGIDSNYPWHVNKKINSGATCHWLG